MSPSTAKTIRRLFMALLGVLAGVALLQLIGGQLLLTHFDQSVRRLDTAQTAHRDVLQALTDAETGLRGYQLTGRPNFLAPYRTGTAAFPEHVREVRHAVTDPGTLRLLAAEQAAADRWFNEFAEPRTSRLVPPAADDRGKELFDEFRAAHTAAAAALTADRRAAGHDLRVAATVLQACLLALAALAALVTVWLSASAHRVLGPLSQVRRVLDRRSRGDLQARPDPHGPPELRQLVETLNRSLDEADQAHRDLATQKAYLAQLLDVINVGVLACDLDGNLVQVNQAARADIDGPPPTHVNQLNRVTDLDGRRPVRHPLALALDGEIIAGREMTFTAPGRPAQAVMVDARPLHDHLGAPIGAVATRYDVSVLREREAELTAFAGVVAHDLRAPLAAVHGFAEILAEDLASRGGNEDLEETLARLVGGLGRMSRLIDDLLAYATARDSPLKLEPVDLREVVDEVITERTAYLRGYADAGRALGVGPDIAVGPLPVLQADAAMIRQVFDNLIGNAIKYTREHQPASVRITADPVGEGWADIHIADRGIGIPADQHAAVFDTFHRAHPGDSRPGTGLGLAICQRVVTRHGGSIAVDDNPGGGSRFHVRLPLEGTPIGSP